MICYQITTFLSQSISFLDILQTLTMVSRIKTIDKMGSHQFIEISSKNKRRVLKLLECRLPRASMLYNVVKLYMALQTDNNAITISMDAYNGDVDSEDSFILATINVKGLPQNLVVLSAPLFPTRQMLQALTNRINWSQPHQFEGIENTIIETLVKHSRTHGKVEEHDPIELYYLPAPNVIQLPNHSDNEIVKQLSTNDVPKINGNWPAASEGSFDMLKSSIEYVGSAGVYLKMDDGNLELVSWAVALPFGSIHALHTVANHQRKGYATLTITAMSQFLRKLDRIPIVQIYKTNDTSKSVNTKIGFVYSHDINLLHYYPVISKE